MADKKDDAGKKAGDALKGAGEAGKKVFNGVGGFLQKAAVPAFFVAAGFALVSIFATPGAAAAVGGAIKGTAASAFNFASGIGTDQVAQQALEQVTVNSSGAAAASTTAATSNAALPNLGVFGS